MTSAVAIQTRTQETIKAVAQVFAGSLILALSAQIVVPLPFSPVPIALHPTVAVLLGLFLGPTKGALACLAYLFEGAMGLPVFMGGAFGAAWLVGPTGGYLAGFAASAWLAGYIAQKVRSGGGLLAVTLIGHIPLYVLGVSWLAVYTGLSKAFLVGALPFLPGCLLKSIVGAGIVGRLRQLPLNPS